MWAREPCGFSGAHPALHIHMRATDHGWEDGQTATLNGPSWALLTPTPPHSQRRPCFRLHAHVEQPDDSFREPIAPTASPRGLTRLSPLLQLAPRTQRSNRGSAPHLPLRVWAPPCPRTFFWRPFSLFGSSPGTHAHAHTHFHLSK